MQNIPERVTGIIKGEAHLHPDCRSITLIKTDEWKVYILARKVRAMLDMP